MMGKISDSLSLVMDNYISKHGIFEEYEVNYSNYVKSVVIWPEENKASDTLFDGKLIIFGNNDNDAPETRF